MAKTKNEELDTNLTATRPAEPPPDMPATASPNPTSPPGTPLPITASTDPTVTPAIAASHRGGASVEEYAVRLYNAFAAAKVLDGGLALPPFGGLSPADQRAWFAVAEKV